MNRLFKYFGDTAAEMKQVSWPTNRQAIFYTILVIVISAVVALYIGLFDYLFSEGVNFIISRI
jgi:preprotein translocase subunit SecE